METTSVPVYMRVGEPTLLTTGVPVYMRVGNSPKEVLVGALESPSDIAALLRAAADEFDRQNADRGLLGCDVPLEELSSGCISTPVGDARQPAPSATAEGHVPCPTREAS